MLLNDPNFNLVITTVVGAWSLEELPERIEPVDAASPETLRAAFKRVMHCDAAKKARNIVFIWAVDKPYRHESGNRLESTIAYIEMTTNSLAGRWPKSFFYKITTDFRHKGDTAPGAGLEKLAHKDKNFRFYSRLIREHGPMRILYADLKTINAVAKKENRVEKLTIRAWEKALIQGYRHVHGKRRRPLKNRRD